METNLSNRILATVLALATLMLVLFAALNFQQDLNFQQPDDGIWWVEVQQADGLKIHGPDGLPAGLIARQVPAGSPGEHAGIRKGDILTAVNDEPVHYVSDLIRQLYATGTYGKADYAITRRGISLDTPAVVIPEPPDRSHFQALRIIGLVYLSIGIYVLFRRWTAPHALHFYVFCLVSFALNTFHYTGKLDLLDWTIYWGNVLAEALQPALFLHFALAFPQERLRPSLRRWLIPLIYLPALAVIGLRVTAQLAWQAGALLEHRLDQISTTYVAIFYLLVAVLFLHSYARANTPLLRQQLKWLTRGTLLAVLPFTFFYALPYLFGMSVPGPLSKIAELSLIFLPLTFSWAIVRYRLMDTDLIFKRGVAYTLATGALVGGYFAIVALAAEVIHSKLPEAVREWGLVISILVTAQLFDPLKRRIQSWLDRVFDRRRYDYRHALVEFGRGLNSETDLRALLESIVDRLPNTLNVARVAVFLAETSQAKTPSSYHLAASHGLPPEIANTVLSLGFLDFDKQDRRTHIFFENAQQVLHLPEPERETAAELDLNYYVPCRIQNNRQSRTIAVIGLGRTLGGDFLSSEDVELLESLASYIGIAIQNAILYSSLEEKITQFERLKEFNENIVESINVGIFAIDLEGRIESWNAQMENMYGLRRKEAIGQMLSEVFPAAFMTAFESTQSEAAQGLDSANSPKGISGVHHLLKFHLDTRTAEPLTANIAIAPLFSRDFIIVGRIILVDDITERISLETQLAQADKLSSIGLLAAGVAHEINTPLAVISSYAQMLAKQVRDDTRLAPVLEKITQQSFRASEIASGLLNFSRTATTELRQTDLNVVLRETLALVEHQFKTANIHVDLTLSLDPPLINGNSGKLQQVFLNLLLNAKDAMQQGGRLHVETRVNGHVEVIVTDNGSGIEAENLKRIYDPFFTTKTQPKPGERRGTGLGLAVSYGIIQEHAGKIQVSSQVGVGTTFHLEFPLVRKSVHA